MKTLLVTLSVALIGAGTAKAEIYRPSVVRDTTVLGAVAGALIGGHNDDRWAQGALIGAAAGAVVGSVIDQSSRPVRYTQTTIAPVAVVPDAPVVGAVAPSVVYVTTPPPQQVVYVDSYPPPVIVSRPIIHFSAGWGPRYHWGHHRYVHRHPRHVSHHWRSHHGSAHHGRSHHAHRGRDHSRGHRR